MYWNGGFKSGKFSNYKDVSEDLLNHESVQGKSMENAVKTNNNWKLNNFRLREIIFFKLIGGWFRITYNNAQFSKT